MSVACNNARNNLDENRVGDPHSDGAWLWDNSMGQTSLSNDSYSLLPVEKSAAALPPREQLFAGHCPGAVQSGRWLGYGLDEPGIYSRRSNEFCSSQERPNRLCSLPSVSCAEYRGVLSTGVRYQLPPSSAEVENERSYTSISPLSDFRVYTRTTIAFCLLLCQHARYPNNKFVPWN